MPEKLAPPNVYARYRDLQRIAAIAEHAQLLETPQAAIMFETMARELGVRWRLFQPTIYGADVQYQSAYAPLLVADCERMRNFLSENDGRSFIEAVPSMVPKDALDFIRLREAEHHREEQRRIALLDTEERAKAAAAAAAAKPRT